MHPDGAKPKLPVCTMPYLLGAQNKGFRVEPLNPSNPSPASLVRGCALTWSGATGRGPVPAKSAAINPNMGCKVRIIIIIIMHG